MCRITRLCASFLFLAPLSACEGPPPTKKAAEQVKAEEAEEAKGPGKTLSLDDGAAKSVSGERMSMPKAARQNPKLRDPSWFRPTIFADAKVLSQGRAAADENGLFSSQITLQLDLGVDEDTCVRHLLDSVGADVPGLEVEDKGDRRSITGETSTYSVVLLCGEAKGRMTAYISYTWTAPPPA